MSTELPEALSAAPRAAPASAAPARPRFAADVVLTLALISLGAHLMVVAITPYELHRDELLYLAMGKHLQLWRMDFPPAIALLSVLSRSLLGDTLLAVRLTPAIAGGALVLLAGLLARELGGGRTAQGLAAMSVLLAPLFVRPAALFQPVVFDQLWWTLGLLALARLGRGGRAGWWLLLGLAGGLGLLTKFSILFFGLAVLIGLLLSGLRRSLATPWPYLSVALALLIGSPSLVGQFRLGFPVVPQLRDLRAGQLDRVTVLDFLSAQLWMVGPAVLLALAGLVYLLVSPRMRPYRVLGWSCLAAFLLLLALHGKPYYAGPVYPTLIAAGAAALGAVGGWSGRALRGAAIALVLVFGALAVPFGLPLLPPASMARYAAAARMTEAVTTNRGARLELPQDYADMLGWEAQTRAVAHVLAALPSEQRAQAVLVADNYGEAGALDFYGPRYGLPPVVSPAGSFWFFGPGERPGAVVVALGSDPADLARYFRSVRPVTRLVRRWGVPEERDVLISVASDPVRPLQAVWPSLAGQN